MSFNHGCVGVQFVPARTDEQFHDRLVSPVAIDVFIYFSLPLSSTVCVSNWQINVCQGHPLTFFSKLIEFPLNLSGTNQYIVIGPRSQLSSCENSHSYVFYMLYLLLTSNNFYLNNNEDDLWHETLKDYHVNLTLVHI